MIQYLHVTISNEILGNGKDIWNKFMITCLKVKVYIWWEKSQFGVEYFDFTQKEVPLIPQLRRFRSTNIKDVDCRKHAWRRNRKCKTIKTDYLNSS